MNRSRYPGICYAFQQPSPENGLVIVPLSSLRKGRGFFHLMRCVHLGDGKLAGLRLVAVGAAREHGLRPCPDCFSLPGTAEMIGDPDRIRKAQQAIIDLIGPWERGTPPIRHVIIDCPICKSHRSFRFDRPRSGNIRASCTTRDCVQWAE